MPWETKFNIDNAINQAANVFWAKGYKSTSLSDLLNAMKINKGSFYNTFGSKKELFTKAIDQYGDEFKADVLEYLTEFDDPILSISTFFDLIIKSSCEDPEKKGCFIFNIASELPNHDDDTIETVNLLIDDLTGFLAERLEKGVSMNLVSEKIDIPATSKALFAFAVSIRVLSRGIMGEDDFLSIKTQALKLIKQEN